MFGKRISCFENGVKVELCKKLFLSMIFSLEGDFLFGKEYARMMFCLKGPLLCCFVFRRQLLIGEKQMLKVRLAIEKESHIKICL